VKKLIFRHVFVSTFLIWNFFQLFRRTQNQHQISNSAFFDTHIAFLQEKIFCDQLDLFANLEVNAVETAQKQPKTYIINVS
jgi:hypothetical protein